LIEKNIGGWNSKKSLIIKINSNKINSNKKNEHQISHTKKKKIEDEIEKKINFLNYYKLNK